MSPNKAKMPDTKSDPKKKWLPDEDTDTAKFYNECKACYKATKSLTWSLKDILAKHKEGQEIDQDFDANIQSMATVLDSLRRINLQTTKNALEEVENCKKNLWKIRLWIERLAISKLSYDIITYFLDSPLVESVLRLAHLYNESLLITFSNDVRNINVYSNKCPMLLYPLRKLSVTKLLQILAKKRAESCSFMFVEGLLNNYMMPSKPGQDKTKMNDTSANKEEPDIEQVKEDEKISQLLIAQESISSDTSIEIYRVNRGSSNGHDVTRNNKENVVKRGAWEMAMTRTSSVRPQLISWLKRVAQSSDAIKNYFPLKVFTRRALTKHLTQAEGKENYSRPLELLLQFEEKRMRALLGICAKAAPQIIGSNCIKVTKTSGKPKVKKVVKEKLTQFYQEVLWGEVGSYVEHGLLWWTSDPLGTYPPSYFHQLRDYIIKLKDTDSVPQLLIPAMNSLVDALCCHITSTSWDQLFRKTLVFAGNVKNQLYSEYDIQGSPTGQLFTEMLADLVLLSNSCESSYLHLEELPLVEQIPVLHRLDHSVHTVRLWTANHCKHLAACWNLDEFYCTCYTDISKCLEALAKLQLADHGKIPRTTSVQVTVCAQMRAKLTSEVRENIEKLKKTPGECINVLGRACRTQCLANLHMSFPPLPYWRQSGPLPEYASEYVENYLDCILRPVFTATNKMSQLIQLSASSMILRFLCESWLEYIYSHRIKFSEWGAVQLLTDFGAVPTWLMERVQLPKELLHPLVTHEVLRRCEGVGRLLLRRRGESIAMSAPLSSKSNDESSADNMPAEMYVPNQEQWLELRAPLQANICCQL